MTELENLLRTLEGVRETSSILLKKERLQRGESPLLRRVLALAYGPKHYGIGRETSYSLAVSHPGAPMSEDLWWQEVLRLLELDPSSITRLAYSLCVQAPTYDHRMLLVGILTKDLRLGLSAKTILSLFPNLFPYFGVQLAHRFDPQRVTFPCYVEPKFDGVRAIWLDGRFLSRYGHELHGPQVSCDPRWVLDGELVAADFQETISAVRLDPSKLVYVVFDFIPRDEWTRQSFTTKLSERRLVGSKDLSTSDQVRLVDYHVARSHDEINRYHQHFLDQGLEGSMIKLDTPYELKRSHAWLKIKPTRDMTVTVTGVIEGFGKYTDTLGALCVQTPSGVSFQLGTGFTDTARNEIWSDPTRFIGRTCEITFQELTRDGVPRFARFKRWTPSNM